MTASLECSRRAGVAGEVHPTCDAAPHRGGTAVAASARCVRSNAFKATLVVPREQTSAVAAQLFQLLPIEDITIEDPEVEDIIGRIFTEKLLSK